MTCSLRAFKTVLGGCALVACILVPSAGLADAEHFAAAFISPLACPLSLGCASFVRTPLQMARRGLEMGRGRQLPLLPFVGILPPLNTGLMSLMMALSDSEALDEASIDKDDADAKEIAAGDTDTGNTGSALTRKERRRQNRKTRNSSRNRLAAPAGAEGSIRRNDALSQHFLSDESVIMRLVSEVKDTSAGGKCVVELGPGLGSITSRLLELYPKMTAVELDGLAVKELNRLVPALDVRHMSLLDFDFAALAKERGGRLTVLANVPFGITSQTLYKLLDNSQHIRRAVLVLQQEAVNRVMADQSQRKYSTLSVEHMLRCEAIVELMKVPSIAFTPAPRRTNTAAIAIDYAAEPPFDSDEGGILRAALTTAFDEGNKPRPLGETIWKSSALRSVVPDIKDVCFNGDSNWLRKRPAELAPGKWLHVARSLSAIATTPTNTQTSEALTEP